MAVVTATFDTITKFASATLDGQKVENFMGINIYSIDPMNDQSGDEDEYHFGLELVSGIADGENWMRTCTRVCASEGQLTDQKEDDILDQQTRLEVSEYFGLDDA